MFLSKLNIASLLLLLAPFTVQAAIKFEFKSVLNFTSMEDFVVGILNVLIIIMIPITVLFIIYAGFMYVTAQGNAEQIKTASRSLTYAIIGAILIIGAVAMSGIIADIVSSFLAKES